MAACICSIVKFEELYLEEWIRYNLGIGFDHMFLYDNSDEMLAIQSGVAELFQGRVTIKHYPGLAKPIDCYSDFIRCEKASQFMWCAFIDADEFIVMRKHSTIKDLLKEHGMKGGGLALNWVLFGSAKEKEYRPEPVTFRFCERQNGVNPHVKTIARLDRVVTMNNPHFPNYTESHTSYDTSGNPVRFAFNYNGPEDVAVIHHYFTKSYGEWLNKQARRRAYTDDIGANAEFFNHDENKIHDESAKTAYSRILNLENSSGAAR